MTKQEKSSQSCMVMSRKYYLKNKEKIMARAREWKKNNMEKWRKIRRKYQSSEKYKKYRREYQRSPTYQKWLKKYHQSEKGKANLKRGTNSQKRKDYQKTDNFKASITPSQNKSD